MASTGFLVMGVALVCLMGILVGVWYFNLEDVDIVELEFTISMDRQTSVVGDDLNLTFRLSHDAGANITVTEFWLGASLDIQLVNSSGELFHMNQILMVIDLSEGVLLQPGVTYNDTIELTESFGQLPNDQYSVNVTYINYHSEEGMYQQDNGTRYFSNTLTFTVEEPPLPAKVSFALLGNETVVFDCEVADTVQERAQGLMHRESLPQQEGMLFVFHNAQEVSFWMKNTLIPLDIIFIDANSVVTNVEEADVQTGVPDNELTRYHSDGPILFVLEINQGLSESYGIDAGTVSTITYLN